MPLIELETIIEAPLERCFDLSRSIDLHLLSSSYTEEKVVAGKATGLFGLHEEVTWRARHFGVMQTLAVTIDQLEYPHHFRDSMVHGVFKSFSHDHFFSVRNGACVMVDTFNYCSPLGVLVRIVDYLFLRRYMQRFLEKRNLVIKQVAESEQWRTILGA